MEKVLELYKYIDGVNDTPFPNKEEQIVLTSFRYDAKRMGGAPSITCTIIHDVCLDELWDENVYTTFRGEKYYIKNVASSSYSNTDTRYHHDAEFVSERVLLDNVYFYDVVDSESETDRPASNSSDFAFFGDINEFAKRLNQSFQYSGFEYRVVVDDDVDSEDKLVSVQDKFISSVLQEIYNTYDIPYYFIGKEIHVGYVKDDIDYLFKYGEDESLLSIQKQNANNKIINRITGRGSADNIPYYYPNDDSKGEVSILYNGVAGNVTVVDAAKYKKVQLSDTFSYFEQESSKIPLLEDATPTINSTKVIPSTSELTQYRLDFSYSFTLETSGSVVLNIQSYLVNTTNIYYDVYDVGANTLLGRYLGYTELELDYGEYSIEVRWEFGISKAIGDDDGFLEVINQYITPTAELIKEAVSTWRFNGKNVELDDYGLSVNKTPSNGDSITFHLVSYIKTQTNLMPSIYRQTGGDERFYNALNQTYKDPSTGEYYVFDNPYTYGKAKEHIVDFDDIKPSIVGISNASGARIDMFTDFAYDLNDNDDFDEEGNYKHPYFFGKLRRFDGEYGFNLFDHAIEEDEMVISMTSGSCGSCEWVIGVGSENQKNLVQVDDDGNLLRDEDGNVRCGRKGLQTETPQDRQNDTLNYEVWVALKKDFDTFNVLMPNAKHNYKPSTQDTFVILHIDLPKAYILSAEDKLTQSLIDYMAINNSEKFNFSISFSRIFFAENTNILTALDENSRIKIEYNGIVHTLYVSSYSYAVTDDNILPEVKVELVEALTITENAIQSAVSEVKLELSKQIKKTTDNSTNTNTSDIDAYIIGTNDSTNPTDKNVYSALRSDANYLKKTKDDRSVGTIASNKGFVVGTFQEGTLLGTGGSMFMREGSSYQEIDFLTVRKKATFTSIEVHELKHVGGEIILSPAAMICSNVEDTTIGYKCYFNKEDSDGRRVYQEFEVGDQARCQIFNLEPQADGTISSRYYWRLVIEVGEDYIVLSKTDCDAGSDIPIKDDHICQMGNREKSERQNAVLISAYGDDAPSYKQYTGIKSYSLEDAELVTKLSPTGNIIKGTFLLESGKNVQDELEGVKVNWDKVLTQTDKEFTMWFYPYSPSASNLPELDWTTDELRALHEEDLFYNTSTTDEDGGKAWRYVYDEASGTYLWELVTDAETIKALEKAAKAQETADEVTEHLNKITSDGVLSSLEKKEVLKEWEEIKSEYEQNIATAKGFDLEDSDTALAAYKSAYLALGTYMNNGNEWDGVSTPSWLADLTSDEEIDANDYRSAWVNYYDSEKAFSNWLSTIAKEKADDADEKAGSKRRNFVAQPIPPYDIGDTWSNATYDDGETKYEDDYLVCIRAKTKDEDFDIDDWKSASYGTTARIKNLGDEIILESERIDANETSIGQLSVKYDEINALVVANTGNIEANQALAQAAKELAQTATMTGMYSGEEYNQTTDPWLSWTAETAYKHVGAIWYNPDTGVTKRYIGTDNSRSWETVSNASTSYASATYVFQNKNKWSAIAANFDSDGTPTSTSGIVVTGDFAGLFSEAGGVTKAEMYTYVDGAVSGIKITADNVDINNGVLTIDSDSAIIGGFVVGSQTLINEGLPTDSYGQTNRVSLTPYDETSIGHSSTELNGMSGGVAWGTVTGFTVGIKSRIGSTKVLSGTNSNFATLGGVFEGITTAGNKGAVGVWGRAIYSSGSPYVLAGVVGTEINSTGHNTKAQAGVVGYSRYSYGVYADGGKNDIFLANASIGNFGLGEIATNVSSMSSYISTNNILMSASNATLPSCESVPMGRMFLYINGGSSTYTITAYGSDTIASSGGGSSNTSVKVLANAAFFFVKIGTSNWYAFKAYDQ